ncbi:MAG TPA: hypothetical protein VHS78_12240 [Candidatus Elarobacter sp.]|jgi:hypothetical protein|nr:hypothetical protein [Candidatus Elarobacter sp.]
MKIVVIALQSLALLLASSAGGAAAAETFSAVLSYPGPSHAGTSAPVYRRNGRRYRFRLVPDPDIAQNVITVELVMQPADAPQSSNANLLDATGRLHGMQRWTFAASDFAHGPSKSRYGAVRTVKLAKLGTVVTITVEHAGVAPTKATPALPASYRFTNLVVRVEAARAE